MTRFDPSNVRYFQQGEPQTWYVDVSGITTDLLAKGYLMFKTDPSVVDGSASLTKAITTAAQPNVGQILKTAGGTKAAYFQILASDLTALLPRDYFFAIKLLTALGSAAYIELGYARIAPAYITST